MTDPVPLSVVIITFNEERNIGRCLESVKEIADEIVVVDSYSTDRTAELCRMFGTRFIQRAFAGHIQQKNFALQQATHSWVLSLDADEALSPELQTSILQVKNNWQHDGYTMNRLTSYAGQWIRHSGWYPDTKLRLWDRRKGRWGGYNPHDRLIMEEGARISHIKGDILHYAYQNASELIDKIQQYSAIFARDQRFVKNASPFRIVYKTVFAFFRNYILKAGFLDGYAGLLISVSHANGVFYKYTKLYEANKKLQTSLIITTYNRKDALELVLTSVLQQSVLPEEVIIADDGSREDTAQLIALYAAAFPVPLRHCWQEDRGFQLSRIRNKAIAQAEGEYIVMVDGDMVMHRDFIKTHKKAARRHFFIQGSRVLLSEALTQEALRNKKTSFFPWQSGIKNRLNGINMPLLSKLFSRKNTMLKRIRGCNMAFWKSDVIQVNGFNEAFTSWGREDSEFVVRLFNNGIKRKNLKFGGVAYHLHHPESKQKMHPQNDALLEKAVSEKITACEIGIQSHL